MCLNNGKQMGYWKNKGSLLEPDGTYIYFV